VIAGWVTFFRWCVRQGYLPYGEATAAERLDKPQVARSIPATFTPAELKILIENVERQYLPWLALAAFAGLRTEEVCPDPKSGKGGVAWEDFQWDRDVLILRPETAKTGHRRVIPILPSLKAILEPLRETGPVGPHLPPHTPPKGRKLAETTRLGKFVGGWKRNALRHSWISYRAAIVGLAQTSMEAGNSESEAKRSYNDAKSKAEAEEWFAVGQGG
jgi:integrase